MSLKATARRCSCLRGIALFSVVGLAMGLPSTAYSAYLANGLNIQGIAFTQVFDKYAGENGEWSILSTGISGCTLNEDPAYGNRTWYLNPFGWDLQDGNVTWTGNPLTTDLSSGGRGHALFGDGGHITIIGDLYDENFMPLVDGGVLLEADIGGFEVLETTSTSNLFDIIGTATVTPTGGLLYGNNIDAVLGYPGIGLFGTYQLSLSAMGADQGGMGLVDFQDSVDVINSVQFSMITPEPGTALLLVLGACCLRRRRV